MDEEKMKFLINATHDIRSPLTIILSALKKIKSERQREGDDQSGMSNPAVDTIEHNAQRILNLVNQILDVRKIDKQQMQLHCQQTDFVAFTEGVCRMFDFPAKEHNIRFTFDHEGLERLEAWIDRTQFDKVISNLLSNAFKYSNDGGEVTVSLKRIADQDGDGNLELAVSDNGAGIDEDSLKHIFDRFYQGSNSRRMHINGTGIGLNLCKMIVAMHHGTIEAKNRTDDKGAVFTVRLPLGKDHLKPDELESQAEIVQLTRPKTSSSKYRVLIVDDDLEMARYVSSELGRYYQFGICPNGKEGLKELLTNEYDVVVSDVMMPEMDGFTMLRMIKTNINISHIPVIMLTSKADVANRLEGLERGADSFLAKPFDMDELHMVINNLISKNLRLKGKYSGTQQQKDKVEEKQVKGNDEMLMERIMKVVNDHLDDSEFNVDMLTKEVGISRAQLHRKMKDMTGLPVSEFIRNIRLEQAVRLLEEQKINVTQVAYSVGFSNLAHFSTVFRKQFGVSPTEYLEQKGLKNQG
jgi:DNA-binding response OmpR family regulator